MMTYNSLLKLIQKMLRPKQKPIREWKITPLWNLKRAIWGGKI